MLITGIALEVCAAALGTASKQIIAYAEHVGKRWIYQLGAFINIVVGPIVDASAYAFAPQVVIAPLACLDVIFNTLTAPITLRWQEERLTRVHAAAVCLVASGAVLTALFGPHEDQELTVYSIEDYLLKPSALTYLVVEGAVIVILVVFLKAGWMSPTVRGISLGVVAGMLVGNVFCMKGFVTIVRSSLADGDAGAWARPTPYILLAGAAAGAILGNAFMRKGLAEYKGVFMITIFEGSHITAACLSGCMVMREMAHTMWPEYIAYWLAVSLIIGGILLINTASADAKIHGASRVASSVLHSRHTSTSSFADFEARGQFGDVRAVTAPPLGATVSCSVAPGAGILASRGANGDACTSFADTASGHGSANGLGVSNGGSTTNSSGSFALPPTATLAAAAVPLTGGQGEGEGAGGGSDAPPQTRATRLLERLPAALSLFGQRSVGRLQQRASTEPPAAPAPAPAVAAC